MTDQLIQRKNVIFDFDGPICSVFAGMPAPDIAHGLRHIVSVHGIDPSSVAMQEDPFEILRWAGTIDARTLRTVEDALVVAEEMAVATAEPTLGAHDLIQELHSEGVVIGIASNNSAIAIRTYLSTHGLASVIRAVSGRRPYAPETMKPSSDCLTDCLSRLDATIHDSIFVGDSLTDIQAARSIKLSVVAFANKPGKLQTFVEAGANVVVSTLEEFRDLYRGLLDA